MKNVKGIIDTLNNTEFSADFHTMKLKYKIGIGSQTKNEYGTLRTRYYINGVVNAFNWNPDNFSDDTASSILIFKFFMQKAYVLLVKKLSLEQFVLLDLKHENGIVHIFEFRGPDYEGGPANTDEISTSRAVSPWNREYENKDWTAYHTERFDTW